MFVFQFLSIFDWFTPLKGFVEDARHDPTPLQSNSWTFFIPYREAIGAGWNQRDVVQLLRDHEVETWGCQITDGELFFSVALAEARWAEYVLLKRGVPISPISLGAPGPGLSPGVATLMLSNDRSGLPEQITAGETRLRRGCLTLAATVAVGAAVLVAGVLGVLP